MKYPSIRAVVVNLGALLLRTLGLYISLCRLAIKVLDKTVRISDVMDYNAVMSCQVLRPRWSRRLTEYSITGALVVLLRRRTCST